MTKLANPNTEQELRTYQRYLFDRAKKNKQDNLKQKFKGLMEIISSEVTIMTAIHNIKSNKGSQTKGTDDKIINDFLEKSYSEVIDIIQEQFKNYSPSAIRRVYIPKLNGKLRPLGIPTMLDRIIQECIKIVIEPILEAQFFNHSYGFRPYRDASQAIERIVYITKRIGYHIALEGDIKGCFDNMNHRVLIQQLWNMGIKDKRLLSIISTMLKSPISEDGVERENTVGLPQGGVLSPVLANAYMHKLDSWITREWESKRLRTAKVARPATVLRRVTKTGKKCSTINNPEFFVRYADDWVLITDTQKSAEYWKYKITKYLKDTMKLELSQEKTHITNMKKKPIKFLGFNIKSLPILKDGGYVGYVYPDKDKVSPKVKALKEQLKKVRRASNLDWTIHEVNILNSKIRGIINYYSSATGVNETMRIFKENLKYSCYKAIKKRGGKWIPANQCVNLAITCSERTEQVPAIKYKDQWYGIISIGFATWEIAKKKNQEETPYTAKGIQLYITRTDKVPLKSRVQELLDTEYGRYILKRNQMGKSSRLYTFEFYMNRCYAFNRDNGKCKVCGKSLEPKNTETHHIDSTLPNNKVNKVSNLATVCEICHENIHRNEIVPGNIGLQAKELKKLFKYRKVILNDKSSKIVN